MYIEVKKMKKISNNYNEDYYHFVTDSGLNVYYLHRPGFKKSTAVLASPFGALHLEQEIDGQVIKHPQGLAHFLEHKLFEDDEEDVFHAFTEVGASANAFTSYDQTMYYFNQNNDLLDALDILLRFVRRFDIDEKSVEKEKPIIVEEIKMYEQMPDMKLLAETYQAVFHEFPFIYDIAGTSESVNNTSLKDLQTAYSLNYHDQRLVLVVIGNEEPSTLKDFINQHPQNSNNDLPEVKNKIESEPLTVNKTYHEVYESIETEKMSYSFKFEYKGKDRLLDRFAIRRILDMNFSEMNEEYQEWLDNDIISDFFSYDVDLRDGFGVVYFFNQSSKYQEFQDLIDYKMKHLILDENKFNQLLRRNYGEIILSLSQFDNLAFSIARSHFEGHDYFGYIESLKALEFNHLDKYLEMIKSNEKSFVLMKRKK